MSTLVRPLPLLAALSLSLALPPSAQSLTQTPLTVGQLATQTTSGATPSSIAFFLYSFQGTGPGLCLGPESNDCLSLLDPLTILATRIVTPAGTATHTFLTPPTAPLIPVHTQALLVTPTTSGLDFATTNTLSSAIAPLSSLSDTFDAATLDTSWQLLHPELAQLTLTNSSLRIRPLLTSPAQFWYHDGEGVLVYKPITGDFDVRTRALAHAAGSSNPPPLNYRLGGLLVRNPLDTASGTHDFVHIAVGAGDAVSGYAVERKTTIDSNSQFALVSAPHEPLDLRIVRTGSTFALSWKQAGAASWTPLASFAQPQMPATVHVGLMAYCASAPLDLELDFEFVQFAP